MKRKVLAILTAALLMLSLSSCTLFDSATAYMLYSKAVKTIDKAGGYEVDCDMTITIDLFGEGLDIPVDVNVKSNNDMVQISTDIDEATMYTTVIDDAVYVDYDGLSVRYSVRSDSEAAQEIAADVAAYDIPDISEELFENIEVTVNDDRTKQITLNLEAEDVASLWSASDGLDGMTFDNVVFSMNFTAKNDLESMHLDADCSVEVLGLEVSGSVEATYTFINFGEAPEIVLPSAYDEYTDGGEYTTD